MAKTEVAVKKEHAIALAGAFETDAHAGFDGMSQEDFALPFLKLLTNTSPEVGVLEGALPGKILNSVTGELYDGKEGIQVVSCAYVRQYIEWAPRGSGSGAPIAIYPATSDILTNTANHYVMVIDADGVPNPALIVMKSTQLKKSRKWNSMAMSVKLQGANGLFTPPLYSQLYRLTTQGESNDKGKWFGWEIERIGTLEDMNVYNAAKAFAASIGAGEVKVKHEGESASTGDVPF